MTQQERPPNEDVRNYDWYILRVWTGREKAIAEALTGHGFASFVVLRRYFRYRNGIARAKGQKELRVSAVMPGYVFLGSPGPRVPWHLVFEQEHAIAVLGEFERPTIFDADKVWRWMQRQRGGEFDAPEIQRFMESHREFEVGDDVTQLDGPMAGTRFRVEAITGPIAEMVGELLGGPVRVKSRVANLVKW